MKSGSLSSSTKSLARLAELSAQYPELSPYLTREMALRARQFMNGVQAYRHHTAQRQGAEAPIVWTRGTTLLRDYAPQLLGAPVVLVIPSLVNRFTILDLHPQHSFLKRLTAEGLRPLVVDWGAPGHEEHHFSLSDYITDRLQPALQFASVRAPAHILGYCMGGLLALALAQLSPLQVRSLSLLATPWDFHAGYKAGDQDGIKLEEQLEPWLHSGDVVPVDVIHNIFTSFQPLHAMHKFSSFADTDPKSMDAERFVLTEDWLNDGVPLPAQAARECFGDLCTRNVTARGEWRVGSTIINPKGMRVPSYAVVPGRDRIVPPESAMPLAYALSGAVRHEPFMGHIGIMASGAAPEAVWTPLAEWLGAF